MTVMMRVVIVQARRVGHIRMRRVHVHQVQVIHAQVEEHYQEQHVIHHQVMMHHQVIVVTLEVR